MLLENVISALEEAEIPCSFTRFATPPQTGPYITWGEAVVAAGADALPNVRIHAATLRVCENPNETGSVLDTVDAVLTGMAGQMTAGWSRKAREWVDEQQVYQTEYSFEFIDKIATV